MEISTFLLSLCTCTPLFCMEEIPSPRTKLDQEELQLFKEHNIKFINPKIVRESDEVVESVNSFLAAKRAVKLERLKRKLQHVSSGSDDDVRSGLLQSDE